MKELRELTKAEDQLMRVLWELKKGIIKEIADSMPEPKPAYNTIATVLKVLKGKGFVDYESVGNTYVYFPLIGEKEYTRFAFNKIFSNYFNGSYQRLVSFLVEEKKLDAQTRDELLKFSEKLKED
jgi:BlaI family transcriptional regulator, penicillinase repressor